MKALSLIPVLLMCTVLSCSLLAEAQAKEEKSPSTPRNLSLDDTFKIKGVGSPALSHDGRWVAYTVTTKYFEENSSTTRIWMQSTEDGEPVPMSADRISSWAPRFSRDGEKLYFLSARNGDRTQLWSLDLVHGGEAQQITSLSRGVNAINLSRDETKLLLVWKDEHSEKTGRDDKETTKWVKGKPWVIDRLQFKTDYAGYLDRRRTHVYVYDLRTEKVLQITSGDHDDGSPAWSPDGKTVAFVSNRTQEPASNFNKDIWLVDADNTDKGQNLVQLTTAPGADVSPIWHPNGKTIAYVSTPDVDAGYYATNHLATIDVRGGKARLLTETLDRNVSGIQFSEDGKTLHFSLEDSAENHIACMPANGGKISRPMAGQFSASGFALAPDNTLVASISKSDQPGELYIKDTKGLRQLTQVNQALFAQIQLGQTEEVHFKSHDGLEIEGLITKPPSFNPAFRYPTLLLIHGGPTSQFAHGFSFEAQFFAAHDYVVVRCNPRGSTGYGQAFCHALHQGWGEKDYRDVIAAVDHAIELGYADPERLGVGGFSYGGILTNYIITQSHRFKGAVSGAGSGLYTAMYGHDMYQHWYESDLGLPWENPELYARLSPFTHIHKATTPTLFVCGEKDWNVPVQNSEQLYQAMRRLGITAQLVVYPGEHHGGWSFPHSRDYQARRLAWFNQYVKGLVSTATAD